MKLEKFKLVKNRQRPDFCFSYEFKTDERKYQIFTMNGGKSFIASIDDLRMDGRWYSEFCETFDTIQDCLGAFDNFNQNEIQK